MYITVWQKKWSQPIKIKEHIRVLHEVSDDRLLQIKHPKAAEAAGQAAMILERILDGQTPEQVATEEWDITAYERRQRTGEKK